MAREEGYPEGLAAWEGAVAEGLPVLSAAQARVLALWSYAMVVTGSCSCHTAAVFLRLATGAGYHALRQRLREWCYDAGDKCGLGRREVVVAGCFAALLGWVLRRWAGTRLALALDATTLGDRFVVLTISVVYRGCAIPVAWRVLPAQGKGAWRREWLVLLRRLRPAVPPGWEVLVLADRGLYARWLYRRVARLGWHPFLRVNNGGTFHATRADRRVRMADLVPAVGDAWAGPGVAFTGDRRLACTLVACWEPGHTDPWLVLTDLAPAACRVEWYGLRGWIEQGFKTIKRGGWQWQHTRMTDPARAERLWLALAVATFWVVAIGEAAEREAAGPPTGDTIPAGPSTPRRTRLFRLGHLALLAALATARPLPLPGTLSPDAWPGDPPTALTATPPDSTTTLAA